MRLLRLASIGPGVALLCGFECSYTTLPSGYSDGESDWNQGDNCDYAQDWSEPTCSDDFTLLFCNASDQIQEWSCSSECEGGFCDVDSTLGYEWCFCPDCGWERGCPCFYETEFDHASCGDDGDTLLSCSEDNIIDEVSCREVCGMWFGSAGSGECDQLSETGYDGCHCSDPDWCGLSPLCSDALWLVQCVDDVAEWIDCNVKCVDSGSTQGVCRLGKCLCD